MSENFAPETGGAAFRMIRAGFSRLPFSAFIFLAFRFSAFIFSDFFVIEALPTRDLRKTGLALPPILELLPDLLISVQRISLAESCSFWCWSFIFQIRRNASIPWNGRFE